MLRPDHNRYYFNCFIFMILFLFFNIAINLDNNICHVMPPYYYYDTSTKIVYRSLKNALMKFGRVIEDSLSYRHNNLRASNTLAPPRGQIWTYAMFTIIITTTPQHTQ